MIGSPKKLINWLYEKSPDKVYEVNEVKDKRSLNANSYLWKLCTLIAEKLNTSKEEVYLEELKRYGISLIIPVEIDTTPNGYFKYYEYVQNGILNGKECSWYKVFKGSSEYNTYEMSVLLNGVVADAKDLDIPTLDDFKLGELIEKWKV